MFAVAALVLSGVSVWISLTSYRMASVIEEEQRLAVVVESRREEREDDQKRKNASQAKFNTKVLELIKELMK